MLVHYRVGITCFDPKPSNTAIVARIFGMDMSQDYSVGTVIQTGQQLLPFAHELIN